MTGSYRKMQKKILVPDINNTIFIHGFIIGVENSNWNLSHGYHDIFELTLCVEGNALQWIDKECVEFKKGDWMFLNPGVKHKTMNNSTGNFTYMAIHFDIDDPLLRRVLKSSPLHHIPYEIAKQSNLSDYVMAIDRIIQKNILMKDYFISNQELSLLLSTREMLSFQAQILLIISEYIHLIPEKQMDAKSDVSKHEFEIAHGIAKLLEEGIFDNIQLLNVSRKIGLSRSHCNRIFNKVHGSSPRQYYTDLKLKKAKELLLTTNHSIEEISNQLGFSSVYHFSRQFKRWTSISPSQYRLKPARF
jgi:AraC family transcriptional regulator